MAVEQPIPWDKVTTLDGPEQEQPFPPLNIFLIGQGPFAVDVMHELSEDGHKIVGVVAPMSVEGKKDDAFRTAAGEKELTVHNLGKLKKPAFADEIINAQTDLIVGANLTATIYPYIPEAAANGMIAFHPSLLPEYKGRSAINWQLINGEETEGLTEGDTNLIGLSAYKIEDDGDPAKIDSGRIVGQTVVEVPNDYNAGSLYREVLADFGVRLMRDSVRRIAYAQKFGNSYRGEPQTEEGSYQKPLQREHTRIYWEEPANRIHNLIRGAQNTPGAWTNYGLRNHEVTLFDSTRLEGPTRFPGQIASIDEEGLTVEARQGLVRVKTVQPVIPEAEVIEGKLKFNNAKPQRMEAVKFAEIEGLAIGYQLK